MSPLYGAKPGLLTAVIVPVAAEVPPVMLTPLAKSFGRGLVVYRYLLVLSHSTTVAVLEPTVTVSSREKFALAAAVDMGNFEVKGN